MEKIKLCAITTISNTINAFMLESLIDMANNEFEVTIVTDVQAGFIEKVPRNIKCYDIKMERKADIIGGLEAIKKIYSIFKKEKFDIIQFATPNAAFYSSIAGLLARVPKRVYLQWGIRYVGFTGFKRRFYKQIEKITCLFSSDIRAASPKNLEFSIKEKLYKKNKVKVIGDGGTLGVDLKKYKQYTNVDYSNKMKKKLNINNQFVFGFVGSIRKDKGVNELLYAFKKLLEVHSNVILLIMGKEFVDDPIDKEIKEWALKCDNIIFTGYISNVPKYLSVIDVLIHPSYREGFSMVIQEAQALHKAVITTDIPGPSEVIYPNKTGVLVPVKNIEKLLEKMILFVQNPELAIKMGNEGYKRVEQLFSRERMVLLTYEDRVNLIIGKSDNDDVKFNDVSR